MKAKLLLVGALGSTLVLGAGAAAFAATSGSTSGSGFSFLSDLASHLNISTSTLKKDIQQTELDRVQALVQSGKLTSSRAAKIDKRIESGKMKFGFGPGPMAGPRPMRHAPPPGGPMMVGMKSLAKDLGMKPKTLLSDLRGGKTLAQVITAQGKSSSTIEADLKASLQTKLDKMVSNKKMTSARETTILNNFDSMFQKMLTRSWPAHGPKAPPKPPKG